MKGAVPRGVLRGGVGPVKQQMLQMLGKTVLARLFTVSRVATETLTKSLRRV